MGAAADRYEQYFKLLVLILILILKLILQILMACLLQVNLTALGH